MNRTNIFLKSYQSLSKLKKQYYHIHRKGDYDFNKDIKVITDNEELLEFFIKPKYVILQYFLDKKSNPTHQAD